MILNVPGSTTRCMSRFKNESSSKPRENSTVFVWPGSSVNGKEVRLLYVGRISREKDLDVLAAAYKKIREAGHPVKLYLVGLGPYSEALAAAIPDAVFLGYLKGEALAKAYASADVFVFPSTTDTFGNVVLEAQASGLPVIVSDLGGPKELVEDGTTGIVTKANDAEDFARAIDRSGRVPPPSRPLAAHRVSTPATTSSWSTLPATATRFPRPPITRWCHRAPRRRRPRRGSTR